MYDESRVLNDDSEFSAVTMSPLPTDVVRSDATALKSAAGVPSPTPALYAPFVSTSMSKLTSTPVAESRRRRPVCSRRSSRLRRAWPYSRGYSEDT